MSNNQDNFDLSGYTEEFGAIYLSDCIRELLIGLEMQHIDTFMKKLSPINCRKLGEAYSAAVREKLNVPRSVHELV